MLMDCAGKGRHSDSNIDHFNEEKPFKKCRTPTLTRALDQHVGRRKCFLDQFPIPHISSSTARNAKTYPA
ncbi:unnamed protein product [Cylicocyclus nassatus]|uniref:Uncharacterized protein n=1 Tax=Cylicocyclus nassatus TaxID=53992 RepID=A0AA36H3C0_CYLNA|nr:unnamed protein product [Cylicocyclus nassatus]